MLAVFTIHYGQFAFPWQTNCPPLWAGVDLFFVLSGFLITGILLDAKNDRHFFRNFYGRRALRIFPLFYGTFVALLFLAPLLQVRADAIFATNLLYLSNLFVKGAWLHTNGNPTILYSKLLGANLCFGQVWSLCVEEQYYLAWPLVVYLIRSREALLKVCAAGTVLVVGCRVFAQFHSSPEELATHFLYYTTWSRSDSLLIGSALAAWIRGVYLSAARLRTIAYSLMTGSATVILLGFALWGHKYTYDEVNPVWTTYGYTAVAIFAAGLLLRVLDEDCLLARSLRARWLVSLGKVSYGMYFLHGIAFDVLRHLVFKYHRPHLHLAALMPFAAFAATLTAAKLSYHFWETPFLQFKRYFQPDFSLEPKRAAGWTPQAAPEIRAA